MTPYRRNYLRGYLAGLRCARGYAPDTETDGGACAEDISEEMRRIEELLRPEGLLKLQCTCCGRMTSKRESEDRLFNTDQCRCGGNLLPPKQIVDDTYCLCGLRTLVTNRHESIAVSIDGEKE